MGKKISEETIKHISKLSMLELSDEEVKETKEDIEKILDYINILNELDTDGVMAMSHVYNVNNVFREDTVTKFQDRDNIISNAPEKKDGYFRIPFIS